MKRDMDLARKILFDIEESPSVKGWIDIDMPEKSNEEISYHIKILYEAGLIEATDISDSGSFMWKAKSLTWAGHEFLDSARDDNRWKEAKNIALRKVGTMTFEVLKQILASLLQKQIFPNP